MKDDWVRRWMGMALHIAEWSKDDSSQVGVVVVGEQQRLLTLGYNGLPRGCSEAPQERHERPEKYFWYEHAERNAIYNAAANGIALAGSTMFAPNAACCDCARAVVQSGIKLFVYFNDGPFFDRPDWLENLDRALTILHEGGVHTRTIKGFPK